MLTLLWNLSAATLPYLRHYMPTNRAVDRLLAPRGLKWAIPVALVATPTYLGLTAIAIQVAARPGLDWLNVLVLLFFWNAGKFASLVLLTPVVALRSALSERGDRDALIAQVCVKPTDRRTGPAGVEQVGERLPCGGEVYG